MKEATLERRTVTLSPSGKLDAQHMFID